MKQPLWSKGESKVVFPYLARRYGLQTFIETGVGFGDTIAFMHPVFKDVYSIENHIWNFELASALFEFIPNIHLLFGDSRVVLPQLLEEIRNTPTFFWLDAHGIPGKDDGPLAAEIQAVMKYRPDALIAIDDVGQNTHHDVALSSVEAAGVSLEGWKRDYRFGRIMFLHKGQYEIPKFE